ncbi:uncharacterized protein LOC142616721 [Castanea sativa]|uniref:uncharacterized protein LOC142616721 n=1 Tax=Castanea sativa TaxID=21020 RepID=UPI003F651761
MPRTFIKGQVLANLVAEFTESAVETEDKKQNLGGKPVETISLQRTLSWKLLGFSTTNNEAEYEALLVGMAMVQKMEGKAVDVFSNSRLVMSQVKGELEARDLRMQEYLSQARRLQSGFEYFTLQQIPRSRNTHADSLATLATSFA